jgi:hypothetical protein
MKKSTSKQTSIARDRLERLQTRVIVERDNVSSVSKTLKFDFNNFFLTNFIFFYQRYLQVTSRFILIIDIPIMM